MRRNAAFLSFGGEFTSTLGFHVNHTLTYPAATGRLHVTVSAITRIDNEDKGTKYPFTGSAQTRGFTMKP